MGVRSQDRYLATLSKIWDIVHMTTARLSHYEEVGSLCDMIFVQ